MVGPTLGSLVGSIVGRTGALVGSNVGSNVGSQSKYLGLIAKKEISNFKGPRHATNPSHLRKF